MDPVAGAIIADLVATLIAQAIEAYKNGQEMTVEDLRAAAEKRLRDRPLPSDISK